ncbi:glycosyltransferase [Alteromonas sp.]|nr:glycosyltransferase [Alteromonas sp.]
MDLFNHYLPWTKKRIENVAPSVWDTLFSPCDSVIQDQHVPITNLMILLHQKIKGEVRLTEFKARANLVTWFDMYGRSIFNIDQLNSVLDEASQPQPVLRSNGVNLVGYSRGRLGLGEDIRSYAALLDHVGENYSVVHIGHPSDDPVNHKHVNENPVTYDRSIFFLNALELKKCIAIYDDFSSSFGRSVAVPPWELTESPSEWREILRNFEQVWGISHFTTAALEQVHENARYSAPVVLSPQKKAIVNKRNTYKPFRFLFIFDAASFIARKNPIAVIEAFQLAFARFENVELVIKVSNVTNSETWSTVERSAASDSRIKLVSSLLTDKELDALWSSADCYVSLHRSEGLGRTIAEAILRKIPVIATNWSGSVDLFPTNYPFLVSYTLVALAEGDYPYYNNQQWAAPSVEDAAEKMQRMAVNKHGDDTITAVNEAYDHVSQTFGFDNLSRPIKGWLL